MDGYKGMAYDKGATYLQDSHWRTARTAGGMRVGCIFLCPPLPPPGYQVGLDFVSLLARYRGRVGRGTGEGRVWRKVRVERGKIVKDGKIRLIKL